MKNVTKLLPVILAFAAASVVMTSCKQDGMTGEEQKRVKRLSEETRKDFYTITGKIDSTKNVWESKWANGSVAYEDVINAKITTFNQAMDDFEQKHPKSGISFKYDPYMGGLSEYFEAGGKERVLNGSGSILRYDNEN